MDGTDRPDAQGADDRAPGDPNGDAVAAVGSAELTLERELRAAALKHLARTWGFESWRAYAGDDLASGVAGSRAVFDIASLTVRGLSPLVEAKLRELDHELNAEVDNLQGELNDVRQVLAELGVPANPALSLRRHVRQVIWDLRGDVAAARRERDEHRQAANLLKGEVNAVTMERDDALRMVDRWIADHDRAAELAEAWHEEAQRLAGTPLTAADVEMMRLTTGATTGVEPSVALENEENE